MANRFDPFRDLDRMAERIMSSAVETGQSQRAMPIDLYRQGDRWILQCDLPGVDPGSIDVDVDERVMTIRAQRTTGAQDAQWLAAERVAGTFARQLTLGNAVDLENVTASYTDGVLTLVLPVAEAAKPRKISVESGGDPVSIVTGRADSGDAD